MSRPRPRISSRRACGAPMARWNGKRCCASSTASIPATRPESARHVAGQRDAVHDAAIAVIVVDRVVLRRAIVPEGERTCLPVEAAGEVGLHLVAEEEVEDRRALLLAHADKAQRVAAIDVERLAAGL